MRRIAIDELPALAGVELGESDWVEIHRARIADFADATGDHQWIHVDEERAALTPYRTTVAHGMLVLSLIPAMSAQVVQVDGAAARINYGLDRVRFPSPVPTGARIRDRITLLGAEPRDDGGVLARLEHRITASDSDRPACVAVTLTLFSPEHA